MVLNRGRIVRLERSNQIEGTAVYERDYLGVMGDSESPS